VAGSLPPKYVSPSRLARFYYLECERYLRFTSVTKDAREREGVPDPPYDTSPVTQAILDTGEKWEEEVVDELLTDAVHVADAPPDTPLSERIFDQARARELISTIGPGEFIFQAELSVPDRFYGRYDLDPEIVRWTPCRPDLIECVERKDGSRQLRVIDMKASPGVKLSHRIQATVYSLILDSLVAEWGLNDRTVAEEGGIWLAKHNEPEYFELRSIRPPIEQFLEHELQPLMEQPAAEAPWHVYYRCEWCQYFEHCREEMLDTNSVSRVPYLSTHAKRYLESAKPPIRTIDEFGQLLSDPGRHGELDGSASLRGKGPRLSTQVDALQREQVNAQTGSSLAMPVLEHVRVILTAQNEPVSGQLYAYGLYAHGLKDIFGEDDRSRTIARVAPDADLQSIVDLERALVRDLWELFQAVDSYNAEREEWREKKSLQVFTYDTYERDLIVGALLDRLADTEVAEQALRVLFQLQGPDLLQAEEHPANEVFFPIVVLNDVLRDRLALPVEVSYRFADANRLLQPSEYGFEYHEREYFSFALSNQMRSDVIHSVWYAGESERLEWIESEIKQRLWATSSLVNGIRERLKEAGAIFAYPPKFEIPRSFDYDSPLLSRLAFLAQYESVLAYIDLRTRRMTPLGERIRSGDAIVLRYRGGTDFEVVAIGDNLELAPAPFPGWLLARRDDVGQKALLGFDDYWNRDRVWVRKGLPLRLAGIADIEGSPATNLRLTLTPGPDSPELEAGAEYVLCPRFTDWGTDRTVAELRDVDDEGASPGGFLELVSSPQGFAASLEPDADLRADAMGLAEEAGMTPSQLAAMEGVLDRRLQLVWGPPGTGKTYFLALAILCFAEAHRRAGLPLRVALTAFTHAAIENAIRKLCDLQKQLRLYDGDLPIGKLDRLRGGDISGMEDVERDSGDAWLAEHEIAVLAGTVWALRRTAAGFAGLVVIDEGSQVRVPESAIAVRRLALEGRLVLAGDDHQLAPIIRGAYPEPTEDEPLLHRSIFECLRRQDPDAELTRVLLENWRMNETLCRYPREQIYVPEYAPATSQIAARQLDLSNQDNEWADVLLDPEHPLVVCVLEGVQAGAENTVEAALVGDVTCRLRERALDINGDPYGDEPGDDAGFWRSELFIVSPHHAQIRAIREALDERREWKSRPFVDTVDKMQGQECDAVIVSYGVSDVEYAMSEQEFIYSLNRLNVSITRARAKTIVFLPLPLLEPPVAAFEDDAIAEGIAFMQGLWRFAEVEGDQTIHELDDGAQVRAHTVKA
jgi:DNA replication ATP-dependent helicase/nuclease Dna2